MSENKIIIDTATWRALRIRQEEARENRETGDPRMTVSRVAHEILWGERPPLKKEEAK